MSKEHVKVNSEGAVGKGTSSSLNILAYVFLVLFSFISAFSLPGGRVMLAVCVLVLGSDFVLRRCVPKLPRTAWVGLAFLVLLTVSTLMSDRFCLSDTKLDKLIWFIALPATALLIDSVWRIKGVLAGYASGVFILALKTFADSVRVCLESADQVSAGLTDYKTVLINAGSMTDGQRFMVGIVIVVGLIFLGRKSRRISWYAWICILVVQVLGLLLTFKRGSLICAALILVLFAMLKAGWKPLLLLLVVVVGIVLLPPVRTRLSGLSDEFSDAKGGRLLMWTKIAPELVKQRPFMGMGYRMLRNEDMVKISARVERDRDHLHSNPVQILVDGGLVGLTLYLLWMFSGFLDAGLYVLRSGRSTFSVVSALMLAGLFIHGIVEYNFGDSELVLLYGLAMGCCAAGVTIFSDDVCHRVRVPGKGQQ